MLQFEDIQISDMSTRAQFIQYWQSGQYQTAIDLLTSGGVNANRIMTADNINDIIQQVNHINTLSDTSMKLYRPVLSDTQPTTQNIIWFDTATE